MFRVKASLYIPKQVQVWLDDQLMLHSGNPVNDKVSTGMAGRPANAALR